MEEKHKEYIGDSVYAEMENGMLKLTTNNDGRDSNIIYFESTVFLQLLNFANNLGVLAIEVKENKK